MSAAHQLLGAWSCDRAGGLAMSIFTVDQRQFAVVFQLGE
jgi:hypothetical protein